MMTPEPRRRKTDASNGEEWTTEKIVEHVVRLEGQMEQALEGVSNFRKFQEKAGDFFEYARGQFRDAANRHEQELKTQQAVKDALDAREVTATQWWKKVLLRTTVVGGIIGIIVALTGLFGPTVRHLMHLEFPSIIQDAGSDPAKISYNRPQTADLPHWR
jgi:hypothetical protein